MNRSEWIASHPQFPWLSEGDAAGVERFLRERGWIEPGERVAAVGKAGEGNMNLTLRARTDAGRCVIVKQARPWVEKYDSIAAPWERVVSEARFYDRVAAVPAVASRMPRLLAADAEAKALLLEDLGEARDFFSLYADGAIDLAELRELAAYLAALHDATRGMRDEAFANRAMRELNHAHIYAIPLDAANAPSVERFEPGLDAAADRLRRDAAYVRKVRETGELYLSEGDGGALLHGDFFPGSWLRSSQGLRVIDPEFCFVGDAAFDVGVALAHLALANQPARCARMFVQAYAAPLDAALLARIAACEMMRRLIGVAQLPIPNTTGRRAEMLGRSRAAMMEEQWEHLWPA